MRIANFIFTVIMSYALLAVSASAQSSGAEQDQYGRWVNGVSEPWWFPDTIAKEEISAAQGRWDTIDNRHTPEGENVWAGNYFTGGDTHGSFLRWSPQRGFVLFHVDKCAASVMGFSYGRVVVSPYLIELIPEKTATRPGKHVHSMAVLTLLPVSWRKGRHLVPKAEIADFGDYVAGLGNYNDANGIFIDYVGFFSKVDRDVPGMVDSLSARGLDTQSRSAQSKPIVPPGYERFMKKPIDARIVSRGKSYLRPNPDNEWWDDLIIPVTINAGRAIGLKEKMVLRIVDGPWVLGTDGVVTITKAYVGSSRGIIERPVRKRPCVKFSKDDDCKDPDYEPLRVGSRVTTNPFQEDLSQQ